jgi:hypothetical protein
VIPDGLLSVPPGYDTPFSVEGLHLVDDGRAAIVFVTGHPWAYDTGTRRVVAAYRVRLEGETAPELLFSEEGYCVHSSSRGAAMVKPTNWRLGCNYSGCPVESILALEFLPGRVLRKTIFVPEGERVDTAQNVMGWYEDRFAVQIGSWDGKRHRKLLRYAYGKDPTIHELSDPRSVEFEHALLARNGDWVEARQAENRTVTVSRLSGAGEASSVNVAPWADARGRRPAKDWFHGLGERAGGGLWLHWGDSLVVGDLAEPRRLGVGEHLGRGTEWANAFVYDDDPESLWVGIEVGGGRDYVRLDFAEVDRRARPWQQPTVSLDARSPMPPSVASRLAGDRREKVLGKGVVSIGGTDLYYRENARDDWRLLYAVPDRSIYRMDRRAARAHPRPLVLGADLPPVRAGAAPSPDLPVADLGRGGAPGRSHEPVLLRGRWRGPRVHGRAPERQRPLAQRGLSLPPRWHGGAATPPPRRG